MVINMDNKLKLVVVLLYVGVFLIVLGLFIGILGALHDKRCYELPLNEFYKDKSCRVYRKDR
jgi:hypothetical protein